MSTNRLGRAENLDQFWRQSHLNNSETRVELDIPNPEPVEPLEEIENYPFEGQDRYHGSFDYYFSDWKGNEQTESGKFEYRADSGLFLLKLSSGLIPAEDILKTINDQLGDSVKIRDSISVKRQPLWNFFEHADQYSSLILTGPKGRFDFTTLKQMAHRISPDEFSELQSLSESEASERFENLDEAKAALPLLSEMNLDAEIQSLEDLGINPALYLIERAEVEFEYKGELVSTTYDRGDLNFNDGASEEAREYVVQLFEREVIYPSHGR